MYICLLCAMKNRNRSSKKCCFDELNIDTSIKRLNRKISRLNNTWQIIYDRKYKKYRLIAKPATPDEYVFYVVLNTEVAMELGLAASMITRSVLALHNKLKADMAKYPLIELWQKSGENIIVLQGYDHRHLKYLDEEAKFVVLGKHAVYHRWYHSRIMLVLSVFGRREEIEDIFYGLSPLR